MGDVVNFRDARKKRERAASEALAAANRAKHGRTLGERKDDQNERDRRGALLDQAKLDPPPDPKAG